MSVPAQRPNHKKNRRSNCHHCRWPGLFSAPSKQKVPRCDWNKKKNEQRQAIEVAGMFVVRPIGVIFSFRLMIADNATCFVILFYFFFLLESLYIRFFLSVRLLIYLKKHCHCLDVVIDGKSSVEKESFSLFFFSFAFNRRSGRSGKIALMPDSPLPVSAWVTKRCWLDDRHHWSQTKQKTGHRVTALAFFRVVFFFSSWRKILATVSRSRVAFHFSLLNFFFFFFGVILTTAWFVH